MCNEAINKCLSLPCENGGTCVPSGTEFSCLCNPSEYGKYILNPLPDDRILDWSKLKQIADNIV